MTQIEHLVYIQPLVSKYMDITTFLAIYGAVLGTVGFALSVFLAVREFRKEKRVLKVILEYMAFFEHVQVRIINTNFRPITIAGVGGHLMERQGRTWILKETIPANTFMDIPKPDFPITLEDGKSITIKLQPVIYPYFWDKETKLEVYVYDVEGITYLQTEKKTYNAKYNRYEEKSA
jgi:hypothetical protein